MILKAVRKQTAKVAHFLFICLSLNLLISIQAMAMEVSNQAFSEALKLIDHNSVYKELAQLYMPSLTKQKLTENAHKHEQSSGKKSPELPKLKETEKIELLYALLAQSDKDSKSLFDSVCTNVFNDLELFCGSDPQDMEHSLFSKLDRTDTAIGKIQLQKILSQPLTNFEKLNERQKIIKLLVEQPDLFNQLQESLNRLKKCENDFVWMWKQTQDEIKVFFDTVYFNKTLKIPFDKLNTNETALEAYGKSMLFIVPAVMITSTLLTGALQGYTDKLYGSINTQYRYLSTQVDTSALPAFEPAVSTASSCEKTPSRKFNAVIMGIQDTFPEAIKLEAKPFAPKETSRNFLQQVVYGQYIDAFKNWQLIPELAHISKNFDELASKHKFENSNTCRLAIGEVGLWYAIAPITLVGTMLYTVYYCYKSAKEYNQCSNLIHKKMLGIAGYANELQTLGTLVNTHEELSSLIPHEHLQKNQKSDVALQQILKILSSNTLKKDASYFAFKGRILALFKVMLAIKNSFVSSMQEAGDLDALMSIAKLYKENANNTNGKYCFAKYIKAERPSLKIEGFWHPYLPPHIAVLNNFKIGFPNKNFYGVITGPNGGGKSTILKALILSPWCAQTLTICPASNVELTPFSRFNTYLNMVDHIGKESLYQAEVRRAGELLQMLKNLNTDEFALVIMDEIFTGTNAYEGEIGAYGIAKHFLDFDKVIALFATHFPKLPALETESKGVFKNYKVAVDILDNSKIRYTYKLTPGEATQHIALQILFNNPAFDQHKLHDAYDSLAKR